jgi:hypothetical protein
MALGSGPLGDQRIAMQQDQFLNVSGANRRQPEANRLNRVGWLSRTHSIIEHRRPGD